MSSEAVARWGSPPKPLVLHCLREGKCRHWSITGALSRALHVRNEARHEDLDIRYWDERADPADDNALAILVTDAEQLLEEAFEFTAFPDGMARDVD